jgi:ribosomal-protein-serine acetyltransferase
VVVLDATDRGKGYGREATASLTRWLLETGAERVQAETAASNSPMRAVLERVGFSLEGILRSFVSGESGREDVAVYAVLRR